MFERFTEGARRTVVIAQEEACARGSASIGTEHLLLGVLADGRGVAVQALGALDVPVDELRTAVEALIGQSGAPTADGEVAFTARAKKVLDLSLREALRLGHNYIGAEHILLGLVREGEGTAAKVLVELGADLPAVRQQVVAVAPKVLIPRRVRSTQPSQVRNALAVMSTKVDTEKLMLSLLRTKGGTAARTLDSLGVLAPAVRKASGALRSNSPVDEAGKHNDATLILGVLDNPDSAAARALASFGVTKEEFERRLRELSD